MYTYIVFSDMGTQCTITT